MIEILEFIFSSFYIWLGCFSYLALVVCGLSNIRLITIKNETITKNGKEFIEAEKVVRGSSGNTKG